jgi:hypothetical protein
MELTRSARKARRTNCGICENREVVNNGLCESCAEGIARLINIELPEKWPYEKGLYIAAAASTA